MSSAIVSPSITDGLPLPSDPSPPASRPHRRSSRQSGSTPQVRRGQERVSASPVPTNASSASTSMSTRSRPHSSASPDKLSATSAEGKRASHGQGRRRSKGRADKDEVEAQLGMASGGRIGPGEEGEPELEMLDGITVNGSEGVAGESLSEDSRDLEERGRSEEAPLPPPPPQPPRKGQVIRLLVGGKKRKAEEVEPQSEVVREEKLEREADIVPKVEEGLEDERSEEPHEPMEQREEEPAVEQMGEVKEDEDKVSESGQADLEQPRRAPRKKRKWLKKGEVDPDDPVAVARQKEKHKMIDEAIGNLDRQTIMIEDGSHPQLVDMLVELEKRYKLQVQRLEAKLEAELQDLGRMRGHEKQQAKFNWEHQRETLVEVLRAKNRHQMSHLKAEKTALSRIPHAMPSLREGRGHGGWALYDQHLLHDGKQPLIPTMVDGQLRQRQDFTLAVRGLGSKDAKRDLKRFLVHEEPAPIVKRSQSPAPAYHNQHAPPSIPPTTATSASHPSSKSYASSRAKPAASAGHGPSHYDDYGAAKSRQPDYAYAAPSISRVIQLPQRQSPTPAASSYNLGRSNNRDPPPPRSASSYYQGPPSASTTDPRRQHFPDDRRYDPYRIPAPAPLPSPRTTHQPVSSSSSSSSHWWERQTPGSYGLPPPRPPVGARPAGPLPGTWTEAEERREAIRRKREQERYDFWAGPKLSTSYSSEYGGPAAGSGLAGLAAKPGKGGSGGEALAEGGGRSATAAPGGAGTGGGAGGAGAAGGGGGGASPGEFWRWDGYMRKSGRVP